MTEISPRDRANRSHSLFLQRLAHGKAKQIAQDMGVSDATVSKIKNEQMEAALLLLAHLGLKVVSSDSKCMAPAAFEFLTGTHARMVNAAPQLIWGDEDA